MTAAANFICHLAGYACQQASHSVVALARCARPELCSCSLQTLTGSGSAHYSAQHTGMQAVRDAAALHLILKQNRLRTEQIPSFTSAMIAIVRLQSGADAACEANAALQVKFRFYVPYLEKYQDGPLTCALLMLVQVLVKLHTLTRRLYFQQHVLAQKAGTTWRAHVAALKHGVETDGSRTVAADVKDNSKSELWLWCCAGMTCDSTEMRRMVTRRWSAATSRRGLSTAKRRVL